MRRRRESFPLRDSAAARFGDGVALIAPHYELRRVARTGPLERTIVRTPQDAAPILRPLFHGRVTEALIALYLDAKHRAIGTVEVARGGMNVVHVAPRDLYQIALIFDASGCVMAHNHPSGDAVPSEDDVALTKRLRAAGDLLGVQMLDHLVIAEGAYFSFTSGRIFRDPLTPVAQDDEEAPPSPIPHAQLALPLK